MVLPDAPASAADPDYALAEDVRWSLAERIKS